MKIKKNNPTANAVHVNRPLTNISVAYLQSTDAFIAEKVAPNVGVSKRSDQYFKFDRADFNRNQAEKRADGTPTKGVGYSLSTDTYFCEVYGLHTDIGDQRRANEDSPLNSDRNATQLLTRQLLIRKENDWANAMFQTSVWDTDITGIASGTPTSTQVLQWSDSASTPIKDLRKQKEAVQGATGFEPRHLAMGKQVWNQLMDHPEMIDRVKHGQTSGPVTPAKIRSALIALLDLDDIVVGGAIQNTAAEGATEASSFILGKSALLYYKPQAASIETPSAAYSFTWNGYSGAAGMGQRVKKFRMEENAADRIEVEMAYDFKVVGSDLGVFFDSLVA